MASSTQPTCARDGCVRKVPPREPGRRGHPRLYCGDPACEAVRAEQKRERNRRRMQLRRLHHSSGLHFDGTVNRLSVDDDPYVKDNPFADDDTKPQPFRTVPSGTETRPQVDDVLRSVPVPGVTKYANNEVRPGRDSTYLSVATSEYSSLDELIEDPDALIPGSDAHCDYLDRLAEAEATLAVAVARHDRLVRETK